MSIHFNQQFIIYRLCCFVYPKFYNSNKNKYTHEHTHTTFYADKIQCTFCFNAIGKSLFNVMIINFVKYKSFDAMYMCPTIINTNASRYYYKDNVNILTKEIFIS